VPNARLQHRIQVGGPDDDPKVSTPDNGTTGSDQVISRSQQGEQSWWIVVNVLDIDTAANTWNAMLVLLKLKVEPATRRGARAGACATDGGMRARSGWLEGFIGTS